MRLARTKTWKSYTLIGLREDKKSETCSIIHYSRREIQCTLYKIPGELSQDSIIQASLWDKYQASGWINTQINF